jgi:hypothetical protein
MTTRFRRGTAREAADDIDIWWVSAETLRELRELVGTCARPLAAYHRIGELIARLRPRGSSPFDGTGWFRALARRLGCSTELLGRCQRLSELYSRAAVERMNAAGLGWSHLAVLVRIRDGTGREELMAEAVEKGWGAAELARHAVGLTRGRAVSPRRPQPLIAEYAALLGLRTLVSAANRFAVRAAENWSGARSPLGEQLRAMLPRCGARTRREILSALTELLPTLEAVGAAATACRESLGRLLDEHRGHIA